MSYKTKKLNSHYKKTILASIKHGDFCPFRYEKQMDYLFPLIVHDCREKKLTIMEAGCGQGRLLYYLEKLNLNCNYVGVDYLKKNVDYAKNLFRNNKLIAIKKENFYNLSKKFLKAFDIIISYKTLSWLPDFREATAQMMKVAKKKIYITSLFYDGRLSFETKIKDASGCFSYLNTYSAPEFRKFCLAHGAKKVTFKEMHLDFDLPALVNKDRLQTITVLLKDHSRLEVTGVVILHWKLVVIDL